MLCPWLYIMEINCTTKIYWFYLYHFVSLAVLSRRSLRGTQNDNSWWRDMKRMSHKMLWGKPISKALSLNLTVIDVGTNRPPVNQTDRNRSLFPKWPRNTPPRRPDRTIFCFHDKGRLVLLAPCLFLLKCNPERLMLADSSKSCFENS